ncbi:unnamed protein product, partial [marine sediment metagenome]
LVIVEKAVSFHSAFNVTPDCIRGFPIVAVCPRW